MYFPVSAVGYLFLGDKLTDNILTGLGKSGGKNWMYYVVQALIVTHLIPALVIVINPLCQELEMLLRVPLRKWILLLSTVQIVRYLTRISSPFHCL